MASSGQARRKAAEARARQQAADRRRSRLRWGAIGLVVILAAGGIVGAAIASSGGSKKSASPPPTSSPSAAASTTGGLGPENIPIENGTPLASASEASQGQTVDGIQCQASEQVAYHVHTHLAVYDNGVLRPVPLGIGIVTPVVQQTPEGGFAGASRCYYWLHTHAQDGVIHIESPTKRVYTLGDFFDEWRQSLSATQVAGVSGHQTIYVNGKAYTGDPRDIQLGSHVDIQIDVGTVVPFQPVDWSKSQL